MQSSEWIVLDDMKMNLIAALIVLILAASFTKTIALPFKLTEVKKGRTESGEAEGRSSKILIYKDKGRIMVSLALNRAGSGLAEDKFLLAEIGKYLKKLNPALPVILAVEQDSGLAYDQLLMILSNLKQKGVKNVSLLAQGN